QASRPRPQAGVTPSIPCAGGIGRPARRPRDARRPPLSQGGCGGPPRGRKPIPKATTPEEAAQRAGPRKRATVESLADKLGRATAVIVTDYRGLTVKQLEELRTQLRSQGIDYQVAKNPLARRAAREAGIGDLGSVLDGPVGLALG